MTESAQVVILKEWIAEREEYKRRRTERQKRKLLMHQEEKGEK